MNNPRSRHALAFHVRPGTEEQAARLLAGYRAPRLEIDERTRLVGTTVFMRGTLVVRVIEVEGDLGAVARHLARDPNIQHVERELNQLLAEPYDPADPAGPAGFFRRRLMAPITDRRAETVAAS
jgi:SchA/CurD like domain